MAEGLTGFTHLFNAMRPLDSREPGPIAAALESPGAWFGMIADGVHVDPAVLRLALRGVAQPMLVTDAMPPVGGTRPSFTLYGNEITVDDGRCTRSDGTLAGAALDMASAVRNCVRLLGTPLETALRFASAHPAGFLGVADKLGRLAPGYRADVAAIDPERIEVLDTWVAGKASANPSPGWSAAQAGRRRRSRIRFAHPGYTQLHSAPMIRMPGENGRGAVELFEQQHAHHLMGPGGGAE
jgi:N-acetylglucosamine-6-phosphate deacetylase